MTTPLLHDLCRKAVLIRRFEETLLQLFSQGLLQGTVHTCIGQEWTGVAVAEALEDRDFVFSNHRCHGHYLARTEDVKGLLAEIMGMLEGICGGRGGSQHICAGRVFSNGIQGGIAPVAAGMALSEKLRDTGAVGTVFVGEGTLGEGVLYETLNIAALWNIPLLVVVENNRISQSTLQSQAVAGNITARAAAFGIETYECSTSDPADLCETTKRAVVQVRSQSAPAFLVVDTFRLKAHSKGDDTRSRDEIEQAERDDPISRFGQQHPELYQKFRSAADLAIGTALDAIKASTSPDPAAVETKPVPVAQWTEAAFDSSDRIGQLLYDTFKEQLSADPHAFLLGEDIEGAYGGAFKITRDLSELFPGRVRNTPISEAAITGIASGLAITGMRPVVEIMFGDFTTLAFDQFINHAAKFADMYNHQVSVPMVIRTPMGGRRGYGPTHSQSLEKHFFGIPGTQILSLNAWYSPSTFYSQLFSTIDRPTLVVENKLLYTQRFGQGVPKGFALEHNNAPFPTLRLSPVGIMPDVTLVCYGGMVSEAARAVDELFERHDILCEMIVPQQLYPLDIEPIASSVERTGRLVIAEEGQGFAALGAEIVAAVCESHPTLRFRLQRVAAAETIIPSGRELEQSALPDDQTIVSTIQTLCRQDA